MEMESAQPDEPANTTSALTKPSLRERTKAFIISNYLPLAFLVALIIALSWPLPGKTVGSWTAGDIRIVQAINNFMVFLVSGLTLKTDDLRSTLTHWVGVLYGLVSILALTPCLAFGAIRIPFQPHEFAVGLAIFCVVPTTLGVGVALTAASKGNQALALFLTVATNLLGIVTVPYELQLVLRGSSVVSVDPGSLVLKLILTVLVPTVIGKVARSMSERVRTFVTNHKVGLSIFSHTNLACIIWQTLSGAQKILVAQKFTNILLIILAGILMHFLYLVFNGVAVKVLKLPVKEAIAVLIMSSQKSAPVAVTVISYITTDIAQQGLFAIPAIAGQLTQIFIGSALAKYLGKLSKRAERD